MKWLITIAVFVILTACGVQKPLQRCNLQTEPFTYYRVDSFPVIKHDTIVWEKRFVQVDTVLQYKRVPRWKTRIEYRERIKTLKIKGDTQVQIVKEQAKPRVNWWIVLAGFIVGIMIIPTIKGLLRI